LTSGTRASTTVRGYVEEEAEVVSFEEDIPHTPRRKDHFLLLLCPRIAELKEDPENSEAKIVLIAFGSDCWLARKIAFMPILL
jgi:hypothetical protein